MKAILSNLEFDNSNIVTVYNEPNYPSFRIGNPLVKGDNTINFTNFFIEDNVSFGFTSMTDFIAYLNSLSLNGLRSFKLFLQLLTEEVKLDIPYYPSHFPENGKDYYKVKVSSQKVTTSCMLQSSPLIEKLINHYRLSIGRFDLTFNDLIDYCNNN